MRPRRSANSQRRGHPGRNEDIGPRAPTPALFRPTPRLFSPRTMWAKPLCRALSGATLSYARGGGSEPSHARLGGDVEKSCTDAYMSRCVPGTILERTSTCMFMGPNGEMERRQMVCNPGENVGAGVQYRWYPCEFQQAGQWMNQRQCEIRSPGTTGSGRMLQFNIGPSGHSVEIPPSPVTVSGHINGNKLGGADGWTRTPLTNAQYRIERLKHSIRPRF
jgi:hypothetical protein